MKSAVKDTRNILMISASEHDANLYYATRFLAPDSFVFAKIRGKKHLLMSDLEVDRARSQATVDQVHSISKLFAEHKKKTGERATFTDIIAGFLKKQKAGPLTVPPDFPIQYADVLRKRGFKIEVGQEPFFPERVVKTAAEVKAIELAIGSVERAFDKAVKVLKKSVIKKGKVYYGGSLLTSEGLRKIINMSLMEENCIAQRTIVACGKHAVDPHDEGSGPIYANQSIIMDIFPRNEESRYFADFTRTVVKGKASVKLKKMFEAVREGQEIGFRMIREGVNAREVHQKIHEYFESLGFKTGLLNGRMQGFFHGTGHGLGLDIHEFPRVGGVNEILKAGHVVTVEPGLYYEDAGGIRLEDVVVVTKNGCRNLTKYPKFLEIA